MKYFEKFLKGASSIDDIDISVHCDINIFEWLMKYLKSPKPELRPQLEVNNVISILISSDFLQMARLVDECVVFIKEHIHEVVKLPIHMNCLSSSLLKRIAAILEMDQLDNL